MRDSAGNVEVGRLHGCFPGARPRGLEVCLPVGAGTPTGTSADAAVERFDSPESARKYATSLAGTRTHARETGCIVRMLAGLAEGANVLDLPCGAGRLLPLLVGAGFQVTAADSSGHMLDLARQHSRQSSLDLGAERFVVANALHTPFPDDAFDGLVCNRLFHHLSETATRRAALRELGRICTGPIVVSFFRSLAYDALAQHVKHFITGRKFLDRRPIPLSTFREDIEAAGLTFRGAIGVRPLISKSWYVLLGRKPVPRPGR